MVCLSGSDHFPLNSYKKENQMTNDNNDAVTATANVTDAVKELAAMADRELRSDARKALVDVEEAVGELMAIIEEQKAEIKQLRQERDAAPQDAKRYQWLKLGGLYSLPADDDGLGYTYQFEDWDQLIDADMKDKKEESK
jgi:hypothetical protein